MNEPLDIKTAAARLGVSTITVRRMVRSGRIPAYRVGTKLIRIPAQSVTDFLAASQLAPTPAQ